MDAPFAAWLDQAIDGDDGGDDGHRHVSATVAQSTFEEAGQPQILPGAEGDVDVTEAA